MKDSICKLGDPVLRRKAEPVGEIDESIHKLAAEMIRIMAETNGVGLAAQQIGRHIQICVINLPVSYDMQEPEGVRMNPDISMPMVLINPEITEKSGTQSASEACLSIPDISAPVNRAQEITVSFQNLDGKRHKLRIKGFLARVIQHEVDHLNGMLFVDRVSPVKKVTLANKLKRLKKNTESELGIA